MTALCVPSSAFATQPGEQPLENSKREEVFSVAFRYTESNAQHGCRSSMSSFRKEMCSWLERNPLFALYVTMVANVLEALEGEEQWPDPFRNQGQGSACSRKSGKLCANMRGRRGSWRQQNCCWAQG